MIRKLCVYCAALLLAASLLQGCAVVNTLVSLKYELGPPYPRGNGCVSYVTGIDLCAALHRHKVLAVVSLAGGLGLLLGVVAADRRRV